MAKAEYFLDHRGFDSSVGTLILGVVAPVMDASEVIGIIKVNYKIKEIFDIISTSGTGETFESLLINSQGKVITYKGAFPDRKTSEKGKHLLNKVSSGWEEDKHDGRETIHAFSSVKTEIFTRIPVPGARKGISGEKWIPSIWHVFLEIEKDEIFTLVNSLRNILISIGCLVTILAIIIAIYVSRAISKPIESLMESVNRVSKGESWQEVKIHTTDEIGMLSRAFNEMIGELYATTVSRDRLVMEVKHRKLAEYQIKSTLKEKEALLKEIHHRVKNNLQVVSSMLNIQGRHFDDEKLKEIFKESQSRIKSMALVHEQLYQSQDISEINVLQYLRTLVANIFQSYVGSTSLIKLNLDIDNIILDIDSSLVLGLIVNELCTNSLKHAFPQGRSGKLCIEFSYTDGNYKLVVSDNGVGFPKNSNIENVTTMGLVLVGNMIKQINGTLKIDQTSGMKFSITFPQQSRH